jgi:hypothetical protein
VKKWKKEREEPRSRFGREKRERAEEGKKEGWVYIHVYMYIYEHGWNSLTL